MAQYIIIIKKSGLAIKMKVTDFPVQSRGGIGIQASKTHDNDEVVSAVVVED